MRVCGIEIRGNEAIVVIIDDFEEGVVHVDVDTKRIALENDTEKLSIMSFAKTVDAILRDNAIDLVAIKGRNRRGQYAGGALTFKIEAIIQYVAECKVVIYTPQTVAAAKRNHRWIAQAKLNQYQHEAYFTGLTAVSKHP